MGKTNRKGRSKHTPFIRLHRGVTNNAAWRSLSCEARALLIEIWTRHNGQNNGGIPMSIREARKALGIGNTKAAKAFDELIGRGFIICRQESSFNWKGGAGSGMAREWELTAEECDDKPPKNSFRAWTDNLKRGSQDKTDGSQDKIAANSNHRKTVKAVPETRPIAAIQSFDRSYLGNTSIIPQGGCMECEVITH
jgi:hypothetical protein